MKNNNENDYLNNVNPQTNQNQYQNNQIPINNQNNYYPVPQINTNQQPIIYQQAAPTIPQFGGIQYNFVADPLIELANSVGAKIHQQIEMMEIMLGVEVPNRYHVLVQDLNGQYKYLFKCKEESTCCQRECCTSGQREFKMFIKHIANQTMFSQNFENFFALVDKPYNCACCCCGRPYIECNYSNGTKFGKIREPFTCCDPKFCIYDENDKIKYNIVCDCCQCGFLCKNCFCGKITECLFEICEENGNIDGYIKRLPAKGMQLLSDSDSYEIRFPQKASPLDKLLIILGTILIDYQYFDSSPGEQGQQGIYGRRRRRRNYY